MNLKLIGFTMAPGHVPAQQDARLAVYPYRIS